MKLRIIASLTLASAVLASNAHAFEMTSPVVSNTPITDKTLLKATNQPTTKQVYLIGLNLSAKDVARIQNHPATVQATSDKLPTKVQLGMNGTPVLDQGQHGSCVTFANTGALDALLGKGDYISQLCSLSLGKYLASNGYMPSGWDGSWGNIVLAQFNEWGMISKSHEKEKICGGLSEYPLFNPWESGKAMDPTAYKKVSENLTNYNRFDFEAEPIITSSQSGDPHFAWDGNSVLAAVKASLATGEANGDRRVTFGVIIPYKHCMTGACGTFHAKYDTWSYANEIKNDANPELAGHEMIITGYDDDAVAKDADGLEHKGLLTLRNSWGPFVGDKGDFYMTYDYFTKFALEAHTIAKLPAEA